MMVSKDFLFAALKDRKHLNFWILSVEEGRKAQVSLTTHDTMQVASMLAARLEGGYALCTKPSNPGHRWPK